MQHASPTLRPTAQDTFHLCPECQHSMTLIRTLEKAGPQPKLAAFFCQPCQLADTVPLELALQ